MTAKFVKAITESLLDVPYGIRWLCSTIVTLVKVNVKIINSCPSVITILTEADWEAEMYECINNNNNIILIYLHVIIHKGFPSL